MTPLYDARKSEGGWFVCAIAFLIIGFPADCTSRQIYMHL